MFKKKNKLFKNYKINQLKKIKETWEYLYIFRYIDLNIKETIALKKKIKEFDYKSLILNQNLITQIFPKLKGQGPLLIIYGDYNLNLIKNLKNFRKLELIYLNIHNEIYSNLKIKQFISGGYLSLNSELLLPFLKFIYYLKKI